MHCRQQQMRVSATPPAFSTVSVLDSSHSHLCVVPFHGFTCISLMVDDIERFSHGVCHLYIFFSWVWVFCSVLQSNVHLLLRFKSSLYIFDTRSLCFWSASREEHFYQVNKPGSLVLDSKLTSLPFWGVWENLWWDRLKGLKCPSQAVSSCQG